MFVSPLNVTLFAFFFKIGFSCWLVFSILVVFSYAFSIFYYILVVESFYFGFYLKIDADIGSFNIDFFGFFSLSLLIWSLMMAKCSSESSVAAIYIISKFPNLTLWFFDFFYYFTKSFYYFEAFSSYVLLSELALKLLADPNVNLLILLRILLLSGSK